MTYDRRAICKEAARQWRNSQRWRTGMTWGQCMSRDWAIAKQRRREVEMFHSNRSKQCIASFIEGNLSEPQDQIIMAGGLLHLQMGKTGISNQA